MSASHPMHLEGEAHRRLEEYRRQAEQFRQARLATGERQPWVRLNLSTLKCRALAVLVELGLDLERCEVQPVRAAN
jgi:hypothetical protein